MEKINVLISGTGSMGTEIAKAVKEQTDMNLIRFAFTGDDVNDKSWQSLNEWLGRACIEMPLIKPGEFESQIRTVARLSDVVAVEFAQPGTNNTELFAQHNIPWVSGTTGVKKDGLKGFGVYDVTMAVPLIVIGQGLEALANDPNFERCLNGFKGYFSESHQLWKADESGTRNKWMESFKRIGADLGKNVPRRLEPEGHGYHEVVMHSGEYTKKPLELFAALFQYAVKDFKDPFSGFSCHLKRSSDEHAVPLMGVLYPNHNPGDLFKINHEFGFVGSLLGGCPDTRGAEMVNLYLESKGAKITFCFNTSQNRGTNMGFETQVEGRGIYIPGVLAAIRYVNHQFYTKGRRGCIESMVPVIKK